jgi:hypothetical protein
MQIELDQDEPDLIVEVLRIQLGLANRAQMQTPPVPEDMAQFIVATKQIQAIQKVLKKLEPPIV